MKKIINKNTVFSFIIGGLIFGSIGIYGANNYKSDGIEYSPTDTSWKVSNVNQAINSLYSMKTELDNIKGIGDATAAQVLSGKKAVVKGSTVTGTMKNMSNAWVWTSNGIENYTYSSGTTANMVYVRPRDDWGDGYITTNSKFIVGTESDLKKSLLAGKTLVGVTGTATSDATATAADILKGKTAYVNGTKVTGTNNVKSQVVNLGTGRSFNIKNIVGEEYIKEYTPSDFIVVESGNSYPTFSPEFHTADQVGSINVAISWTDFSISYNQSDGSVTITGGVATATINQYWQRNGARLKTSTNNLTRTPKVYLLVKTPNANV